MNDIIAKINELQVLELMIKNEQKIFFELLKPSSRLKLENYIKLYNKLIIDFFKENSLRKVLTLDKCEENIDTAIMVISYVEDLPFKINQDFVKEMIRTDSKLVKTNYPNYYLLTDETYFENLKKKLIHIKEKEINHCKH